MPVTKTPTDPVNCTYFHRRHVVWAIVCPDVIVRLAGHLHIDAGEASPAERKGLKAVAILVAGSRLRAPVPPCRIRPVTVEEEYVQL